MVNVGPRSLTHQSLWSQVCPAVVLKLRLLSEFDVCVFQGWQGLVNRFFNAFRVWDVALILVTPNPMHDGACLGEGGLGIG